MIFIPLLALATLGTVAVVSNNNHGDIIHVHNHHHEHRRTIHLHEWDHGEWVHTRGSWYWVVGNDYFIYNQVTPGIPNPEIGIYVRLH